MSISELYGLLVYTTGTIWLPSILSLNVKDFYNVVVREVANTVYLAIAVTVIFDIPSYINDGDGIVKYI